MTSTLLRIAMLVGFSCASARGEDWPRWRGPRGDGTWHSPEVAARLPEKWPGEGLKELWRRPIGGGYAGISVAGTLAVTMDRQKEPREVERVVAVEAATGRPLWTYAYPVEYKELDYGNGPRAAPTLEIGSRGVAERIYTLGALGHVACLDAATGKPIWTVDTVARHDAKIPEWGFAASPLLWNDLVIVHVGARPGGCFLALDKQTGRERWRGGDDPAGYATPMVIDGPAGEQLIGWTPEHIVGLNLDDGRVEWKIPYSVNYGVSIAAPIYHEGIVFVAGYWDGSRAIRLGPRRTDAVLAWKNDQDLRGLMSQPLYRDGLVYLLDKQFGITAFELATGTKRWDDKNTLTPRGRNPHASLAWLGDTDRVIALNAEGELVLARFLPTGYVEQSRTKIIGPTWAHPAFAGKQVYARDDEAWLCVELPTAGATAGSAAGNGKNE